MKQEVTFRDVQKQMEPVHVSVQFDVSFTKWRTAFLRSREKEGAYTLCNSMDGTGENYAK